MSEKKRILIFIDWFLPGYKAGGPIRSIVNIIEQLFEYFDFYIVTSDRDLGDESPYENIITNKIKDNGKYKIVYLSPENQNKKTFLKLFEEIKPYKVYFNSLFSVKFTLLPLYFIKKRMPDGSIILAPRGMLGNGALELKKVKKNIFLKLGKLSGLFSGILWHATTSDEAEDIRNTFDNAKIVIAENIPRISSGYSQKEKKDITKFVFISRISKKKNILYAIKILNNLKTGSNIIFDIFGPSEDQNYEQICKIEAENNPGNISVNFKEEIAHNKVINTLKKYHFFLFPTLHENYGHAVFEAFSAGCPVIISDKTPWKNLEEKKIGWDINLQDKDKFRKVIQKCIDMTQEEYDKMSLNAFNFAKNNSANSKSVKQTKKLFEL